MAEHAYHEEARRRKRALDRRRQYQEKLATQTSLSNVNAQNEDKAKSPIMFSSSDNYDTKRNPFFWTGKERDKRQYDHSRNGPLLDRTWVALRKQLNLIGRSTPLTKSESANYFHEAQQIRVFSPKF